MDHSLEEIRAAALDLLAGRERPSLQLINYHNLLVGVGEVFSRRESTPQHPAKPVSLGGAQLTQNDSDSFAEVFWTLFREGIITLGLNDSNPNFPFFRITEFGRRLIDHQQ